jgi:hypothetical protein
MSSQDLTLPGNLTLSNICHPRPSTGNEFQCQLAGTEESNFEQIKSRLARSTCPSLYDTNPCHDEVDLFTTPHHQPAVSLTQISLRSIRATGRSAARRLWIR